MEFTDALTAFGGCARRSQLRSAVSRRRLDAAVRRGEVVKVGRTYSLPPSDGAARAAREVHGISSHLSAARRHGFALPPGDPGEDVLVPPRAKRRNVPETVRLHFGGSTEAERRAGCTDPVHTVVLCLRDLSTRDALSVGDSALRSGAVTWEDLSAAVHSVRGPGSRLARSRLALLDARAENAFESSCRAILLDAGITGFRPQVTITHRGRWVGRVDLADRARKVLIECEGFETHGPRRAFARDLTRHTLLVAAGWRPLRLLWEQVMFEPEWVLGVVHDTIDGLDPIDVSRRARRTTQGAEAGVRRAA
jgi:very-short-patch-repair endonuclease